MAPFSFAALFTLLFISACTPSDSKPVPDKISLPPIEISFAHLSDPSDPRWLWLSSLSRPKFSEWPALKVRCNQESGQSEIDFGSKGPACAQYLRDTESTDPDLERGCTETGLLYLQKKSERCSSDENSRKTFSQLRLPEGFGLYKLSSKHNWVPNETRFEAMKAAPKLRLNLATAKDTPDLSSPSLAQWFASAAANGAIHLVLKSRPRADRSAEQMTRSLIELKYFLERQKEPSQLSIALSLNRISVPSNARFDVIKIPLVNVHYKYSDGLYKEACEFLGRWIRARQLLSNATLSNGDALSNQRLDLECVMEWSDVAVQDAALSVARLAVPWLIGDSQTLPFVNAEDVMNPSRFQSLKP